MDQVPPFWGHYFTPLTKTCTHHKEQRQTLRRPYVSNKEQKATRGAWLPSAVAMMNEHEERKNPTTTTTFHC
jgi:hypothetical protein